MSSPRFSFVPVMDHEMHVTEWGDPSNPALVMWHGLARTGRDFDELAAALSDRYFVLCPDLIGRGLSSWSDNPEAEYSVEYYAGIAGDLLDRYGIERAAWFGTSLGGLIGMRVASGPNADRLRALLINDIGPEIPDSAIERILDYVGALPTFDRYSEAESWLREVYVPFGAADDTFWRRMTRSSIRRKSDGRLTLHYDPRITVQFDASRAELTSWDRWQRIETPMHIFRGTTSDILTEDIAARMMAARPGVGMSAFAGFGHAPTLSRPADTALVGEILAQLDPLG